MWTKLRNVVRGVAQFKQTLDRTSSEKGPTLSTTGENGLFSVIMGDTVCLFLFDFLISQVLSSFCH